jgi:hypothetical protein
MKAIFNLFDFKFIFYANDYDPIHIHVIKEDIHAKFSINPVELVENNGLNQSEVKQIIEVIKNNEELIMEHWNKHFNNNRK